MKKHDFIELEYTGRLDDNTVFDTTDAALAVGSGIKRDNNKFGPVTVCLGEHHVLKGIEEELIGKEPGVFHIPLPAEKAFGKKDAKLLKLIPLKVFHKQKIAPYPGLEVNIDNAYGIVRSSSGGRVIVDFNHPLSGRAVKYDVKVLNVVSDVTKKAAAIFRNELGIETKFDVKEGVLHFENKLNPELLEMIKRRIMELIPEIKDVTASKEDHIHEGHEHVHVEQEDHEHNEQ